MYNLKSIKQEFKEKGIFYTTSDLAEYIKSLVDVENITEVYDPTCGDGSLLSVFPDDILKFGQEINEHQLDVANSRLKNFTGFCGDTLKDPAFFDKKFKCIVANPPFSIKWEPESLKDERFINLPALPPPSKADYAFILHILHYLANDGVAVVLNFPGILYRGNSEGILRKWLIENNFIDKVIRIPPKSFIDTAIETVIIIFKKNKSHSNIEFIDKSTKKSVLVSFEDIAKNDFVLSVNSYLFDEKEVINIDEYKLMKDARLASLKRLENDISVDKLICELEGWNCHTEYIKSLQDLLENSIPKYIKSKSLQKVFQKIPSNQLNFLEEVNKF